MIYTQARAKKFLTQAGWVIANPNVRADSYSDAVKDFQRGYNLGRPLVVDGIVGTDTTAAMKLSESVGFKCSQNFKYREFMCDCKGELVGCRTIRIDRNLLISLEKYRKSFLPRNGVYIVSGYRCPVVNRRVGGRVSPPSHHVTGNAVDVPRQVKAGMIPASMGFKGVGVTRRDIGVTGIGNRRIVHLDNGERKLIIFQE